jgi:hypothetical protein
MSAIAIVIMLQLLSIFILHCLVDMQCADGLCELAQTIDRPVPSYARTPLFWLSRGFTIVELGSGSSSAALPDSNH